MSAYGRAFTEMKYMSFLTKHDKLLEKYNEIQEKVKNSIRKEFDSKPVYNEIYLKAKIKSYSGKINTNFYNNKIPREGSQIKCFQKNVNMLLKKKRFLNKLLTIQKFLLILIEKILIKKNSDKEISDEESSNEKNSNEEN